MTDITSYLGAALMHSKLAAEWIDRAFEDNHAGSAAALAESIRYAHSNITACRSALNQAAESMTRYEPVRLMTAVESCKVANEIVEMFTQACANGMVAGSVNDQELCDGHDHE